MQALRLVAIAGIASIWTAHASLAGEAIFDELRFGTSASVQDNDTREDGVFSEIAVFFDPFDLHNAVDWKQEIIAMVRIMG